MSGSGWHAKYFQTGLPAVGEAHTRGSAIELKNPAVQTQVKASAYSIHLYSLSEYIGKAGN